MKIVNEFFGKVDGDSIKGVMLATVGHAQGHYFNNKPLFADQKCLETWAELGNAKGKIPVTINHSHNFGTKIGWLSNFEFKGSSLWADLRFADVAHKMMLPDFNISVVDYVIGAIEGSDEEFLQFSLESMMDPDDYEEDKEHGRYFMRPISVECCSFVFDAALTSSLFERNKEFFMSEEEDKKKEAEETSEEEKELEVEEETEETEETVTDETEKESEEESEEETVTEEDEEETEEEAEDDSEEDESKEEEEKVYDMQVEMMQIKDMLSRVLDILGKETEEVAEELEKEEEQEEEKEEEKEEEDKREKKEFSKSSKTAPTIHFHSDIELDDESEDGYLSDAYLGKNWKKFWNVPELRARIINLK